MPSVCDSCLVTEAFREFVLHARKSEGLSQRQFCRLAGRSQTWLSNIETGRKRVEIQDFMAVCNALSADPIKCLSACLSRARGMEQQRNG